MVSRIRSRLPSIARYESLPHAVFCVLYSASVMSLYDYCDVVWSPTTVKLSCLIKRVHSKILNKLPPAYHSRFSFTLTEQHRFHMAIQIFKSLATSDFTGFVLLGNYLLVLVTTICDVHNIANHNKPGAVCVKDACSFTSFVFKWYTTKTIQKCHN